LTSNNYLVVLLALRGGLLIALPCVRACLPCCLLASFLACGSTLGAPWVRRIEERVKPQPCVRPIGAEGRQAVRSEPLPLQSYCLQCAICGTALKKLNPRADMPQNRLCARVQHRLPDDSACEWFRLPLCHQLLKLATAIFRPLHAC
jgi:hypothetical protein